MQFMGVHTGVRVISLVLVSILGQSGVGQAPKTKSTSAAKPGMAVWSPDVQQILGVSQENFKAEGLDKLTKMQLVALLTSARIDPRKALLTCPVSGAMPSGRIHVWITVAGDDSTGAIAGAIKQGVGSLSGVEVVDSALQADRALHVVIQEQTMNKRTIGFTASYLTSTPCMQFNWNEVGCRGQRDAGYLYGRERAGSGKGFGGDDGSGSAAVASRCDELAQFGITHQRLTGISVCIWTSHLPSLRTHVVVAL